jgi:hypothetical protein
VRLTTSPPSRAKRHEIWGPKPPGTVWATPGLLQESFTFMATFLVELVCLFALRRGNIAVGSLMADTPL